MSKNTTLSQKSQAEVWKAFGQNPVTHSAAHYLMSVHELIEEKGYARLTDIAQTMDVTPGSCTPALRALRQKGFLVEDAHKYYTLTDEGARLVRQIQQNDRVLELFFTHVLGVAPDQARIDACKMEHLMSQQTAAQLANFWNMLEHDPAFAAELRSKLSVDAPHCHMDTHECGICQGSCMMQS